MTARLVLVAAAALIDEAGRILLAQRPAGKSMAGLWELPGGKIEPGERPEAALRRELAEELSLMVEEAWLEPLTFASHAYQDFHLLMPVFTCRQWVGEARPQEGQAVVWVEPDRLGSYPAPAADGPVFNVLAALGG